MRKYLFFIFILCACAPKPPVTDHPQEEQEKPQLTTPVPLEKAVEDKKGYCQITISQIVETCPHLCSDTLKFILKNMKGILSFEIKYGGSQQAIMIDNTIEVIYDPKETSADEIISKLNNHGFQARLQKQSEIDTKFNN